MSHAVDELYDVYRVIVRRARKTHRCSACGLQISPGERYASVNVISDGMAQSIKRCGRCQKVHEHLQRMGDGETWPDERLACGENYEAEWGGPPPDALQAVVFMTGEESSSLLISGARYHMMDGPDPCTVELP